MQSAIPFNLNITFGMTHPFFSNQDSCLVPTSATCPITSAPSHSGEMQGFQTGGKAGSTLLSGMASCKGIGISIGKEKRTVSSMVAAATADF